MYQFIFVEMNSCVTVRVQAQDEWEAENKLRVKILKAQDDGIELPSWTEFWLETTC